MISKRKSPKYNVSSLAQTARGMQLDVDLTGLYAEEQKRNQIEQEKRARIAAAKIGPPRPMPKGAGKHVKGAFFDPDHREYVIDNAGARRYLIDPPHTIQDAKNNLIFLRIRKGYNQRAFARVLGVSQSTASTWEKMSSVSFCSYDYAVRIAAILETDPRYIDRSGLKYLVAEGCSRPPYGGSSANVVRLYRQPSCLKEIKQNLCYYRLKVGLSTERLAQALDVDPDSIVAWEDLKSDLFFPDSMLSKVATALNCPIEDLNEYGFDGVPARGESAPATTPAKLNKSPRSLLDLKENLRYYREKQGLSLRQAARAIGVHTSLYCDWEDPARTEFVSEKLLNKVTACLHANRAYLFIEQPATTTTSGTLMPATTVPTIATTTKATWADALIGLASASTTTSPLDLNQPNGANLSRLSPIARGENLKALSNARAQSDIFDLTGWEVSSTRYASAEVRGKSMFSLEYAGLYPGDIVVIDLMQREIAGLIGQVVCVAFADGTLWLRRLVQESGVLYLTCDNEDYAQGRIALADSASIVGRVVTALRKL